MYEHRYGVASIDGLLHMPPAAGSAPALLATIPGLFAPGSEPLERASRLFLADNLALMRLLLEGGEKFELIYADPPFNSGKDYSARTPPAESGPFSTQVPAYSDTQGHDAYLLWLRERLAAMRDLLADNGSLYVHLDWHYAHYVKVMLDGLFGRERFLNEIIWCYHGPSPITSAFKRKHDTILVYTRSRSYIFNADAIRVPYDDSTRQTFAASSRAGFGKTPDLERGKVPEDWWYFPVVARMHRERVGYETQKPLALLERIVLASSNAGDNVADFFCGSGTTLVAAARRERGFLGCDISPLAVSKAAMRLEQMTEPHPAIDVYSYAAGDRR